MDNQVEVLTTIKKIVSELPGCFIAYEEINFQHKLREDIGLDSLGMVDLMVAVEDTFQIYFDPIQMNLEEVFSTIGTLTDFVTSIKSQS